MHNLSLQKTLVRVLSGTCKDTLCNFDSREEQRAADPLYQTRSMARPFIQQVEKEYHDVHASFESSLQNFYEFILGFRTKPSVVVNQICGQ